jgi:Holliday junction resolvase RusA-like endonuclease
MTVRYSLPTPPPLNNAYVNNPQTGGRFVSKQYGAWRKQAGWALVEQRVQRVEGPVSVDIVLKDPTRRSDVDNRIKAVLDLLVNYHIIETDDDKTVRKVSAAWGGTEPCVVTIQEV